MLEASADDLELKDGAVQVKGVPQMRKTLAQIAQAIGGALRIGDNVAPGKGAVIEIKPNVVRRLGEAGPDQIFDT